MSKNNCRFVVTKKDDCCYKTTTETVGGLYGVAVPAFPASSTKDSVHVVRYDDALVTYVYNGTAWIETTNTPITSPVIPGVLVDNGDGTYTWTDTSTTFVIDTTDRVLSTVVYSPATQDFTFTWSNGDTTVVDLTGLLNVYSLLDGNNTSVTGNGISIPWEVNGYGVADNSDGTFTVTLPDGVTTFLIDTNDVVTSITNTVTGNKIADYTNELGIVTPINETITSIVNNGDGTATFTNESGVATTFPIGAVTVVNNGDGTYTITLADGSTVTISDTSISTLVDNLDGTYTYTDETGAVTTFNTNDTITTLVDNGDGTLTYTSEDGTVTTFNKGFTSVTNNADGTWTYTYPDLSTTNLDICALLAASSCLPTLTDNGDGTYTFNDGQGNTTTFNGGWTTFANSTNGFTATYPDGSTYVWAETITSLVAATNGWEYTSEDGTTTTVTYLFDNSTPSAPTLLVQVNGTTQATIPLNSYDVNIATAGGFTFNPVTDVITITETDGETHTIDLTPLRTTVTLGNSYGTVTQSINPDGSTNYDLNLAYHANFTPPVNYNPLIPTNGWAVINPIEGSTVTAQYLDGTIVHYTYDGVAWIVDFVEAPVVSIVHSNETQAVPYTGTELPVIAGVTVGDTTDIQFSDGTVVSYTWDGTAWIPDFQQTWAEQRICLNTATPAFIGSIVTGQNDVGLYFNYDGYPFDITSFKIDGNELLTSTINVYDGSGSYIYTNQLVPLFNTYMTTNGYTGSIDDDIDSTGGVYFYSLSGMTSALTFEIITDEGGTINIYNNTSSLIVVSVPADVNNPLVSEVDAWTTANLTIQQRENGTKLVYFVPGDGGSCDVPDYEWTLNKGSQLVTLSNKVEKISNTLFIDNVRGNNTTGLRNYREFPFKTFNASLPKLNDGDWLQYDNTTETIAATNNIRSSSINHFYDFGRGSITINNASSGLIGFGFSTPKNVHIKGDNITLANTTLVSSGDGNVDFNIKKLTTNRYIITSMANTNISIKDFNTTAQGGWFTANNKNININVENLNQTLNNSINSWTDGIFQLEANTAGLPSSNNVNFNVYYGNIRQNAVKTSVYNSNGILNNCNVKVHVNNLFQSTTLASYPIFALSAPFATFSAARFGVDDPIYTGCQFTFEGNNLVTDSPLSSEVSGGVLTNTHINYNITNSLVRKGFSIYVGEGPINSAPINLNNSSISYKGSYTNEYSGLSMIYIKANLTNGSKIIFDGYFKGVSNITFLNTILDATSKIIFKGKYDLGNGFFDISGVTGAGADNIYFEDCTIVTNNAECIVSGTAKNIKILDVRSNKPTSANVTELVSSIIVNSVIN